MLPTCQDDISDMSATDKNVCRLRGVANRHICRHCQPRMQAASRCCCVAIVCTALHCHCIVVIGAVPATQAASHHCCVAVVDATLATQLSGRLRLHSHNSGVDDKDHGDEGGRHADIPGRGEGEHHEPISNNNNNNNIKNINSGSSGTTTAPAYPLLPCCRSCCQWWQQLQQ